MTANTQRLFAKTPNLGALNALLTTAMTNTKAFDGTEVVGTAKALVYTAGADGGSPGQLKINYTSTNGATASGTTNPTVMRFWANSGSDSTVAANNQYLGEVAISAATLTALATTTNSQAGSFTPPTLPAGYRIYAGLTVAVGGTNAALAVRAEGGDF
jgi:hypothetical protein